MPGLGDTVDLIKNLSPLACAGAQLPAVTIQPLGLPADSVGLCSGENSVLDCPVSHLKAMLLTTAHAACDSIAPRHMRTAEDDVVFHPYEPPSADRGRSDAAARRPAGAYVPTRLFQGDHQVWLWLQVMSRRPLSSPRATGGARYRMPRAKRARQCFKWRCMSFPSPVEVLDAEEVSRIFVHGPARFPWFWRCFFEKACDRHVESKRHGLAHLPPIGIIGGVTGFCPCAWRLSWDRTHVSSETVRE